MQTQKKIAILSRSFAKADREPLDYLERQGFKCVLSRNSRPQDTEWIASLIGDADAAIIGNDTVDRYVMTHCPNLKAISKQGVGMDCIDLDSARELGISVSNTPDANNESVADFAIMLMLAVIRNLKASIIDSPSPAWDPCALSNDLWGKTVGLIGYGKIGCAVAQRLVGFGVRILVYDPYIQQDRICTPNTALTGFDELLVQSDIVSLHLPLSESTRNLFGRDTFARMKEGSILINTARGGLVDVNSLKEALSSGKLKGVGLDVYAEEPPRDEPLLCMPNVVATPHVAPHTREANYRMGIEAARNVASMLMESVSAKEAAERNLS